jgi:hypothetical protein
VRILLHCYNTLCSVIQEGGGGGENSDYSSNFCARETLPYYHTKPTCQELICGWSQGCPNRLIPPRATGHPKEYTITHFAGGAMLNYFTSTFSGSSSCSVPDLGIYFGNKKTTETKPIYFEPTQPNEYCIIQNKFQV